MSANLYSEQYRKTIREGFVKHYYVRTYKATTGTNLVTTCQDPAVPQIGSSVIIEGTLYWLVEQQARRENEAAGRIQSYVDCYYDNDAGGFTRNNSGQPATDPINMAPYVQVTWQERQVEQADAYFIRVETADGAIVQAPPFLQNAAGTNQKRYITNTAGSANGYITRSKHFKQIIYWTFHRTWDSAWETNLDTVNSSAFTVTQSDSYGTRLQYSITAGDALYVDLIKEDHWKGDKLYFRRGVVMHLDKDNWYHRIPDKGMHEIAFLGQVDWTKNPQRLFTQPEIEALTGGPQVKYHYDLIRVQKKGWLTGAQDGEAVSEPVELNGFGAPLKYARRPESLGVDTSENQYKLVYQPYDSSTWPTDLGIT